MEATCSSHDDEVARTAWTTATHSCNEVGEIPELHNCHLFAETGSQEKKEKQNLHIQKQNKLL